MNAGVKSKLIVSFVSGFNVTIFNGLALRDLQIPLLHVPPSASLKTKSSVIKAESTKFICFLGRVEQLGHDHNIVVIVSKWYPKEGDFFK